MKPIKRAIKLALKGNTLNDKAIAMLDSEWEYIKSQTDLLQMLYDYHSLTYELLDMINIYRKEVQKLNEKIGNLQRCKDVH